MKLTFSTLLLLIAMMGQARSVRTIKQPEAMACANIRQGAELKAREVIMTDTATIVRFRLQYPVGQRFGFSRGGFLVDEQGRRYALRRVEGIALDAWITSPESGVTDFTMTFEPMPRQTQVFDYFEADNQRAFMLLGIHDRKLKLKIPELRELADANRCAMPSDWLRTDTITIRGRIENYNAEAMGFTSMECYYEDVFEKSSTTLVADIAPDGTFEKRFRASYPVRDVFIANDSKVNFPQVEFIARPGETVDITIKPNEHGQGQCFYNSGTSKETERLLHSNLMLRELSYPLATFRGTLREADSLAERTWQNLVYRLYTESRRKGFTPMEMQLAMADLQTNFALALMEYAMSRNHEVVKNVREEGGYRVVITDSLEWNRLKDIRSYTALHRIDFDNPMLLSSAQFDFLLNRMQFARAVRELQYEGVENEDGEIESTVESAKKQLLNYYSAECGMMGTESPNFMAQMCAYKEMTSYFNYWRMSTDYIPQILADTTMTEEERKAEIETLQTPEHMAPIYLATFTHPYIQGKAEQFYNSEMAMTEFATPLPEGNPAADILRSIAAKYPDRILVVDFWGMGCGPCRSEIQSSKAKRAEIAKRNDVKLVFIAGERTAEGSDEYRKYVAEWLDGEEVVCLTNKWFSRLQDLLGFNGIPHHETFAPGCLRVRDDQKIDSYYNFDNDIERIKNKLNH